MTTKNLGLVRAIQAGNTPPTNIQMLWFDTNVNLHKYYDPVTLSWTQLAPSALLDTTLFDSWRTSGRNIVSDPSTIISLNTGDKFIVGVGATGDFSGQEDSIANWNGASWEFYPPQEGWVMILNELGSGIIYIYQSSTWNQYNLSAISGGLPTILLSDNTTNNQDIEFGTGVARFGTNSTVTETSSDNLRIDSPNLSLASALTLSLLSAGALTIAGTNLNFQGNSDFDSDVNVSGNINSSTYNIASQGSLEEGVNEIILNSLGKLSLNSANGNFDFNSGVTSTIFNFLNDFVIQSAGDIIQNAANSLNLQAGTLISLLSDTQLVDSIMYFISGAVQYGKIEPNNPDGFIFESLNGQNLKVISNNNLIFEAVGDADFSSIVNSLFQNINLSGNIVFNNLLTLESSATSAHTITFPDKSGTVALLDDINTTLSSSSQSFFPTSAAQTVFDVSFATTVLAVYVDGLKQILNIDYEIVGSNLQFLGGEYDLSTNQLIEVQYI